MPFLHLYFHFMYFFYQKSINCRYKTPVRASIKLFPIQYPNRHEKLIKKGRFSSLPGIGRNTSLIIPGKFSKFRALHETPQQECPSAPFFRRPKQGPRAPAAQSRSQYSAIRVSNPLQVALPVPCRPLQVTPQAPYRSKMPPSSALRAARMYLLVSSGSTFRRFVVVPSSRGHSR